MAIEAHRGDEITFYEIDPKMYSIAQRWFSYLSHSPANCTVQIGDGRLLLGDSKKVFDAICIDAFSGDAVPVHLLSIEAMNVYLRHLQPHGLLFFHITNAYLDLAPIIGNAAHALNMPGCELVYDKNIKYVVLSRDAADMQAFIAFAKQHGKDFSNTLVKDLPTRADMKVWTDDYSNLFSILKWHS